MSKPTLEFDRANRVITDAVLSLPGTLEHTQCAIGVLLARAQAMAGRVPDDMRREWAMCVYQIADRLAAPERR